MCHLANTHKTSECKSDRAKASYGLASIFYRSVPPPTVHIHLRLYSDLAAKSSPIPSLTSASVVSGGQVGMASSEEARAFELWLRGVWENKEQRLKQFCADQRFIGDGGDQAKEVVRVRQT
jgi:hypothetical protein